MADRRWVAPAANVYQPPPHFPMAARHGGRPTTLLPAVRNVLTSDELYRHILHFLPDDSAGRRTLLSLATVCTVLSEPALEALWRSACKDDIDPLLPLCYTGGSTQKSRRLAKYTSYVKEISLESGTIPAQLLRPTLPSSFPRLRVLRWYSLTREDAMKPQPFAQYIVPALDELHIRMEIPEEEDSERKAGNLQFRLLRHLSRSLVVTTLDALRAVKAQGTMLSHLDISWTNMPVVPPGETMDLIGSFTHLKTLHLPIHIIASSPNALRILALLPVLEYLRIENHQNDFDFAVSLNPARSGFSALRGLRLSLRPRQVFPVLSSFPQCALDRCSFSIDSGGVSMDEQHAISQLVMTKLVSRTARSIRFEFVDLDWDPDSDESAIPLSLAVVVPHLCTRTLVEVILDWIEPETVTDSLCAEFAKAWPRLRTLELRPMYGIADVREGDRAHMVTLRGLRSLADGCPDLESVLITVNAVGSHWADEARSLRPIHSRRPVSLTLTTSLVTAPEAVAVYLQRCFSSIENVVFCSYGDGLVNNAVRDTAWKRLRALLLPGRVGIQEEPAWTLRGWEEWRS
ncbi:hypothetical protein C8Q80DRAFT_1266820 [Daedaleopsis nitida]|nr:hypothetical protein C8Q80DRAFT_1266820 [Daedaleopsis nitida]